MAKHDLINKTIDGQEVRVDLSKFLRTQDIEDIDIFMALFPNKDALKQHLLDYELISETNKDTFYLRHYFGTDIPRNKTIIYGDQHLSKYAKESKRQKSSNVYYPNRLITPDKNFNEMKKKYIEHIRRDYQYFIDNKLLPRAMTEKMIREYVLYFQKGHCTADEERILNDRKQSLNEHLRKYENYRKFIVHLNRNLQKKELAQEDLKPVEVTRIVNKYDLYENYDREDLITMLEIKEEQEKEFKARQKKKEKRKRKETPGQYHMTDYLK